MMLCKEIRELRDISSTIFLAADEKAAEDISNKIVKGVEVYSKTVYEKRKLIILSRTLLKTLDKLRVIEKEDFDEWTNFIEDMVTPEDKIALEVSGGDKENKRD